MNAYVARLCWNGDGWKYPTGESAKAEHDTYATTMGYGHEEWLFNLEWVLDGWKYGFLQPVNRSYAKMKGQTIDVRLYTISPAKEWFYVGRLPRCEVLTMAQVEHARREFRRRGWLKDMEAQAVAIGGSVKGIRGNLEWIFNVRFRADDFDLYDPKRPVAPNAGLRKLRRYLLVALDDRVDLVREWATRVGTNTAPTKRKQARRAIPATVADLAHGQLQGTLVEALKRTFASAKVVMEEGFTDVKLVLKGKAHLFEIKADPRPRKALREAIGQLLEYRFRAQQAGEKVGLLVVAAPGELSDLDRAYMEHLQGVVGLPLHYLRLRRDQVTVDLPLKR